MLRRRVPAGRTAGGPGPGPGPVAAPRHRHRAARARQLPLPAGAAWPLAAILVVALLGARALDRGARPAEGRLAAEGFLLTATRDDGSAALVAPDGVGALHVAVYAALTRLFDRADTLVAAGRELVLVVTVLSAVLLWRTARRLGFGPTGAAVAVLLAAVPLLLSSVALLDVPARLAVVWLLLAARLTAGGRPSPTALGVAVLAAAVAVLLAPDVLVLLLTGAAAALAAGGPARAARTRVAGALVLAVAALGVVFLLPRWDEQAVDLGTGTLLTGVAAFLLVGGVAAWRLERLRAPAVALAATTLVVLLPSGRLAALTVCLPLAALLAAGLAQALPAGSPAGRQRILRPAGAAALAGAVVVSVIALVRAPEREPGGVQTAAVLGWAEAELPPGARLVADRLLRAELLHAGGDPDRLALPGTAPSGDPRAPLLAVAREEPAEGAAVLARFDGAGAAAPLLVVDPAPVAPTAEELRRRRSLAAALLANPTTTTGGRAAEVLLAGEIDARLLAVLAALGAQFGIGVRDLPPAPGEPDDGPPARSAVLDRLGEDPLVPGAPATERLLAWLDAQLPPFAPDAVTSTDAGVRIDFWYVPDPDALVSD